MLDLSYFQNQYYGANSQTFTTAGSWQTWVKPRGAKYVNILCIGGGAGGGGGFQVASGNKSGGSGGGSAGTVRAQFQASLLPDILYVQCGAGGAGGLGGATGVVTAGGSGNRSFVTLIPDVTSAANIIVTSGAVAAVGGNPGNGTANTPGGAAETIATSANAILLNLGTFIAVAGMLGLPGGLVNASTIAISSTIVTGGAGGGGSGVGGGLTAVGPFPSLATSNAGSGATNAQSGVSGYMLTKPILGFTGGAGGGGIATGGTGTGGNGGNGSYGCGGGGGGASFTTAGNGGRGGDGIIIITTSF